MPLITVRPAEAFEQIVALELLWSEADNSQTRAQESLKAAERGEVSLRELVVAEMDGRLVGAGLLTAQSGRIGFVWPPGVPRGEAFRAEIQHAILTTMARRLDELELCIGQVILDPKELAMRAVLAQSGFPHLTDLHYMVCPAEFAPASELPSDIETETFSATNSERFAQVLDRTYIGTLDCPELDGVRSAQDAIAAHQGTGKFDPNRWWLYRHQNRDAGVLFLNEHPERELLEIVYLGVVPEARGKGLGQLMVERALAEAHRAKQSLVLAVDTRNLPARQIYQKAGFLDVTVQSVHLRQARANARVPQSTDYAQPQAKGERNS
jgi:ribosomal protein S18 acetylase RimI-like enzyme